MIIKSLLFKTVVTCILMHQKFFLLVQMFLKTLKIAQALPIDSI